jgi:chromosome segregation ATPase
LDHRLHQLSAERGPIANHIEGLERHITTMYEELVEEFDNKNKNEHEAVRQKKRIEMLSAELSKVRLECKRSEHLVNGFRRDVGNIANSMVTGKDLETSIRLLYKKVRNVCGGCLSA